MIVIKGTNKGFFGNVLDAVRHISHAIKSNKNWYVDWDQTPYNDQKYGTNAWEYFFVNPFNLKDVTDKNYVGDYTSLILKDKFNFRQTINYYMSNIVMLNDTTKNIINNFILSKKIDNKTLGVHIRKTDKNCGYLFGEPRCAIPLSTETYVKYIDKYIAKFEKIFLASDDVNEVECISEHVSNKHSKEIIIAPAFRSYGNISIHNNYSEISGYKKGLDVLIDCYSLASCGHIIRSTSNVGSMSQFLNLQLTHTNINEIELGDYREKEYNL